MKTALRTLRSCFAPVVALMFCASVQPTRAANPPAVSTQPADNITDFRATLHGTANPNWQATSAWFQWGDTSDYGLVSRATNVGAVRIAVALEHSISGLSPRTTYHFRLVAKNAAGTSYGLDRSFTTPPTIAKCAPDRILLAGDRCQARLPDLTREVVVVGGNSPPGELVITQSPTAGKWLSLGPTVVTFTVTDGLSLPATCQATVTVEDLTAPVLICPTNVEANAAPGECAALVSFTVMAADNCDPAPMVTCTPPSGTFLPVGRTDVACTARDSSGNTTSRTFPVTVYPTRLEPVGEHWIPAVDCWSVLPSCWTGVAAAADGTRLVAVGDGHIWTSTDSGGTWTARTDRNRFWASVASSADGTKLVAANDRTIFTSTDAGTTWTAQNGPHNCIAVASSADGTKLAGAMYWGYIYTSADSGVTWTRRGDGRDWTAIASSADGSKLVALEYHGRIWTSTDSGLTWTAREAARNWSSVASSADGAKLVAAVSGGRIYTSADSGATWIPRESNGGDQAVGWGSVATSTDGARLAASANWLAVSTDSGLTWARSGAGQSWACVASSASGSNLVAAMGGKIYTSSEQLQIASPTILGATDQVVQATEPGGVVVNYNITATNLCQSSVPVTCTPPSGSTFPVGTYWVACMAADVGGSTTSGHASTATFSVTVTEAPPPPPEMAKVTLLATGAFQCQFLSLPGASFTVLVATNLESSLADWTVLGTVTEEAPGSFRFIDTNARNHSQRFYRLRWP